VVARRTQQAASMLASQLHTTEVLQNSILRQSQQQSQQQQNLLHQPPNLNIINNTIHKFESSNQEEGVSQPLSEGNSNNNHLSPTSSSSLNNRSSSSPLPLPPRLSRGNSAQQMMAFPTILENGTPPDQPHPTHMFSEGEGGGALSKDDEEAEAKLSTNDENGFNVGLPLHPPQDLHSFSPQRIHTSLDSSIPSSPPPFSYKEQELPELPDLNMNNHSNHNSNNINNNVRNSGGSGINGGLNSLLSGSQKESFGELGSSGLGSQLNHQNLRSIGNNLSQSDISNSFLASLNNLDPNTTSLLLTRSISGQGHHGFNGGNSLLSAYGGSLSGIGGGGGGGGLMKNEPRSVEAMLQSALREESQSVLLRDTINRKTSNSIGASNNQLLDSINGASFYWLDKYRSMNNPNRSPSPTTLSSNKSYGDGGGGGGFDHIRNNDSSINETTNQIFHSNVANLNQDREGLSSMSSTSSPLSHGHSISETENIPNNTSTDDYGEEASV